MSSPFQSELMTETCAPSRRNASGEAIAEAPCPQSIATRMPERSPSMVETAWAM